jgi:hypothetical protein
MVESPKTPLLLQSCVLTFSSSRWYSYRQGFGPYIDAIWKVLHAFPNLRRVDWASDGVDDLPSHAPFHQLTHVEANFEFSTDDVLAFLTAAPVIEELCISTISILSKITPEPGAPLFLQHLRFLIIRSQLSPASLFSSITCPSLQRLEINHISLIEQPNQSLSELDQLLQRSNCQPQSLDISDSSQCQRAST